ncbi:MAG: 6-phosphogluconolactonase [Phycisphaerales bacterium]|nr:6-phosphogluconolactonase [Phycisphaerales bacterium]
MARTSLDSLGQVHLARDKARLHDDLAQTLLAAAFHAIEERGVFHLALSGGSTPEPFYMNLVIDPRWRGIPWQKTHLWLVDERCVPETDDRSNWKMIRETLADHVPLKQRQLHPMPVMQADAGSAYERELRDVIVGQSPGDLVPMLDFVLLGMGDDGHTASLFPDSPALQEREKLVTHNDGPTAKPPIRLTMTYPLLHAARALALLVTGAGKAAMLQTIARQLQDQGPDPARYPVTGLPLMSDQVTWFMDAAAAGAASTL